jgi:hypothetical protein
MKSAGTESWKQPAKPVIAFVAAGPVEKKATPVFPLNLL